MNDLTISSAGFILLAVLVTATQADIAIEVVPVGNPGNAADTNGKGSIAYAYNIGKFEVTAGQYCEFLNAVAKTDPYGLYNPLMNAHERGCQITRHGNSGSYTYNFSGGTDEVPGSTAANWENRPVHLVSWGDAARFCNWLHNGQTTGAQDNSTTEDGVYDLSATQSFYGPNGEYPPDDSVEWNALWAAMGDINRKSDWKWAIPTDDEWYKAAYHKNDGVLGNYFEYPTSSDSMPCPDLIEPVDPGNNATFYLSSYTIGVPYWRTDVGAHENSGSPYGTFDQCGNVLEWIENMYSRPDYLLQAACRGGSYVDSHLETWRSFNGFPMSENANVGFRVVSVPEPGCFTLFMCGLVSLIFWKRKA